MPKSSLKDNILAVKSEHVLHEQEEIILPKRSSEGSGKLDPLQIHDADTDADNKHEKLSLGEIMEENWRYVFAIVVCIIVVIVLAMAFLVQAKPSDDDRVEEDNQTHDSSGHDKLK